MNGPEVLRIVDAIHRDKHIDKGIVFEGIEQAILSAAKKHYGNRRVCQPPRHAAATGDAFSDAGLGTRRRRPAKRLDALPHEGRRYFSGQSC